MRVRPRSLVAAGLLAVVGLVPLYGDPRQSPVTHPEWARLLLRGLDLDEALEASTRASHIFAALSWRESLAYPADRYLRSDGMDLHEKADGSMLLTVVDPIGGEASYHMAVVRGGDYRMRVRLSGESEEFASAEITLRGATEPTGRFALRIPKTGEWVDAGAAHLDPGVYYASVLLPEGCDLEYIELAPPCLNAVEPLGGWRPSALAHIYDVALTTLQALDMEYELPPASTPEEYGANEFAVVEGDAPLAAAMTDPSSDRVEAHWLRGGESGTSAILKLEIPREGLYTIYAFGDTQGGQRWMADGCQKAILCPSPDAPRWWPVLSNRFDAGTHSLAVTAGPGSIVQRVRVVRKKDSPEDYVAALDRLGLDLGEPGPISRNLAVDAMNFIEGKRLDVSSQFCGDIELAEGPLVAGAVAGSAEILAPGVPPPGGNPLPPGGNPTGPPSDTGLPPGYTPPEITQPPGSPDIP